MSDNGILSRVPGERIAEGSKLLPAPDSGLEAGTVRHAIVLDVRDLGAVRITYKLATHRHGKSRQWCWLAVRADLEGSTQDP